MVAAVVNDRGSILEGYGYDAYGKMWGTSFLTGDFNADGLVNLTDFTTFSSGMGDPTNNPATDLTGDGITDGTDFATFSANLGYPAAAIGEGMAGSDYQFTGRPLHYFTVVDGEDTYELRLADHRRRMYDPHHGRWMQRDPAGYVDGVNLYEYVGSRPTIASDPRGLSTDLASSPDIVEVCCQFGNDIHLTARRKCPKWLVDTGRGGECCRGIGGTNSWGITDDIKCSPCFKPAPEPSHSGVCDLYGLHETFKGFNARCVCKCAGDSSWDQYVRGCLACMRASRVDPKTAHDWCYAHGNARFGDGAGIRQPLDIAFRCICCRQVTVLEYASHSPTSLCGHPCRGSKALSATGF